MCKLPSDSHKSKAISSVARTSVLHTECQGCKSSIAYTMLRQLRPSTLFTQVVLKHQNEMTEGWVEADKRLKPGVRVLLEDKKWWDVLSVSEFKLQTFHDAHSSTDWFKKDWLHSMGNRA